MTVQVTSSTNWLSSVRVKVVEIVPPMSVAWTLPGGARWTYDLPLRLTRAGSSWQVAADQRTVHPQLADGERLRAQRTQPPRGSVHECC